MDVKLGQQQQRDAPGMREMLRKRLCELNTDEWTLPSKAQKSWFAPCIIYGSSRIVYARMRARPTEAPGPYLGESRGSWGKLAWSTVYMTHHA